jgi:CBS domain-containing protein
MSTPPVVTPPMTRPVGPQRQRASCPRKASSARVDTLELDRPRRTAGRVDIREAATVASTGEVMSRGHANVEVDATVEEVCAFFADRKVHAAPVVDMEGKLIGVVSEADIVRWHASPDAAQLAPGAQVTVGDIMTKVAHALPESAPLAYAFGLLAAGGLRQAPVVTDDGRVVGMITATDLIRWVARDLGYVLSD